MLDAKNSIFIWRKGNARNCDVTFEIINKFKLNKDNLEFNHDFKNEKYYVFF
jgi:hypothetical protein